MYTFILDSRNQKDEFVDNALKVLGHDTQRLQLYYGDVAVKGDMLNCIDLKSSGGGILELMSNVCSSDHSRLKREIQKAILYGGSLTFLCFENGIKSIDDIINYKMPVFKSTVYKTCYYDKITHKRTKKTDINASFLKKVKGGEIILLDNYPLELTKYTNNNYYTKREISHKAGDPYSRISLQTFIKALKTMTEQDHYGEGVKINFEFTTKQNCGKKILDILGL